MNIHHFAVVCGSIENADKFYGDILGLEKIKDTAISQDLSEKIFDIACESRLLLYSNPHFAVEVFVIAGGRKQNPSFEHFCLAVEDKQGFIEKCQAGGCDVNIIPKDDYFLTFIRDFDGNLFEIKEIGM